MYFTYRNQWIFFFCLFRAAPTAYGGSQDRGRIRAGATGHHSQSHTGSLTHWARPGMESVSSWMLVRFVSAEPRWELPRNQWIFEGHYIHLWLALFTYRLRVRILAYKLHTACKTIGKRKKLYKITYCIKRKITSSWNISRSTYMVKSPKKVSGNFQVPVLFCGKWSYFLATSSPFINPIISYI